MEGLGSFAPFILMFAVVYFFMIAPQVKKGKQERKFNSELKRGDRIVTIGGIHAKIINLNDNDQTLIVETSAGQIKIERSAVSVEKSKKLNAPKALKK